MMRCPGCNGEITSVRITKKAHARAVVQPCGCIFKKSEAETIYHQLEAHKSFQSRQKTKRKGGGKRQR